MIACICAPTNLGLKPPQLGAVPGTSKAPEALREAGLFERLAALGAREAGVVVPGRYVDDDETRPPGQARNETAIIDHARRLGQRVGDVLDAGEWPLVIGGDCSVILGVGLALAGRNRVGLVHIDGHTDFRHPGNSDDCASVAGEDLAACVGLHWPSISNIDDAGPYFDAGRVVHIGHRNDDDGAAEARDVLGLVASADEARSGVVSGLVEQVRSVAGGGYWIQVDVDVLDPTVMPAVDSPDPGGLMPQELITLLRDLMPDALGMSVTIFDPDLDPGGVYAKVVADVVVDSVK